MAKRISETVTRIGVIIQGLRTFSRDGSGDKLVATSVKRILEDTLVLCHERILNAGIEVRIGEIPEQLLLSCRAVQISQTLLNLISNSCDAVSDQAEKWIAITAEKKQDRIRITVEDSGTGISQPIREKVFQPFFTTKEIGKGTGLGLSISKGIVESHGGTIELDLNSERTRFVLEFPSL